MGARFGRKKSILYQIWLLSSAGFQQYIGTDFYSILPNLGDFFGSRSGRYLSARSGSFLKVPNLVDRYVSFCQIWFLS